MVSVCVRKEISRADLDAAPTNLRVSRDDHAVKECQAAPHRCHMAGTLRFVWWGYGYGIMCRRYCMSQFPIPRPSPVVFAYLPLCAPPHNLRRLHQR
jgi:hypothetical protein